jgi:hypothetical protein
MDVVASRRTYAPPPHVRWAQDADRIIVVDDLMVRGCELRGVEAAIWSWLSLSFPHAKIVRHLAALLGAPEAEAAARLRETLDGWQADGLIAAIGDGSDG